MYGRHQSLVAPFHTVVEYVPIVHEITASQTQSFALEVREISTFELLLETAQ